MTDELTIIRPDDWHCHVREGAMLKTVLPFTAQVFGRAVIMPNLKPPVTTSARAQTYHDEILASTAYHRSFTPLMTLYLTDATDPDDLETAFFAKHAFAAKLYPANATTNAEAGVTDIRLVYPVLTRMQRIGMPLLMHGEVTDPDIDVFDREAVFIDRVLIPLKRDFPELKTVMEHITTKTAAEYIKQEANNGFMGATITAHHLHINRNAMFSGGFCPHYYCLPVAKREEHRQALVEAATSGDRAFFLGTDSAPHADAQKESPCGCAGIFTAPNAMGLYAQVFDDAGKLENLEAFASRNGADFYKLPLNEDMITLKKSSFEDFKPILTEEGHKITAFVPPAPVHWRVV